MIQLFRRFFQSKLGIVITFAFLGIIAFAFASMDVANTGTFGGVAGGDRVAVIGDRRIDAADLAVNANSELDQMRAQNPTISMETFAAQGGVERVLQQMISRWSIAEFAETIGLRAGNRLIDSEIVSIPAFRGVSGEFDPEAFRMALSQRGLNEAAVREDLAMGLLARQVLVSAGYGARPPLSMAQRYAQLLGETRRGSIATLSAGAFAPAGNPSAAQLQQFYDANREDYIRPERRVLRYASFGQEAFGTQAVPTEQAVARRYQRDIASFQPSERRGFTQLVVPTQAAAQAVVAEVRGGLSLEASAQSKGLATATIAAVDQTALAGASSAAVAAAAFAAERGALATPAQGGLGWYVLRVDTVEREPGRTLAQARADIVRQLTDEQRRTALNEATARIEDEMAEGRSLAEVAEELGLTLQTTPPITAAGLIYGTANPAPAALAPIISLAFEMEEGEPQLAETVPGESFLIFDVGGVTPSATAPLAEIREDVTLGWRRDRGMAGAAAAAERIIARTAQGQTLAQAVAAEERELPAPQTLNMDRRTLAAQGQVPSPLMLFFSMAEGTAKRLPEEPSGRWFVVQLDEIETPELAANDPIVTGTLQQLASAAGEEYAEQLVKAIEGGLKVETNQAAVDGVIAQLTGAAN